MAENNISLAVVVVVGPLRKRGQRLLDGLCLQTAVESMEIIVVDLPAYAGRKLQTRPGVRTVYLLRSETEPWPRARADAVRHTKAPIVAFIEDHCIPAPDWAEKLIEAHKEPWAAVGYAFTNANPETYVGRASFLVDYGPWAHPARHGPTRLLPSNNISYKRDLLISFGDELDALLSAGVNIHEVFNRQGCKMFLESRARVAHENFARLSDIFRSNRAQGRLFASTRVHAQSWGRLRRLVYGFGVPIGAPLIKTARLLRSICHYRWLWPRVFAGLPVILLGFFGSAVGESLGYLFGVGDADEAVNRYELVVERIAKE
jgi:glycosyl transferase family 2